MDNLASDFILQSISQPLTVIFISSKQVPGGEKQQKLYFYFNWFLDIKRDGGEKQHDRQE